MGTGFTSDFEQSAGIENIVLYAFLNIGSSGESPTTKSARPASSSSTGAWPLPVTPRIFAFGNVLGIQLAWLVPTYAANVRSGLSSWSMLLIAAAFGFVLSPKMQNVATEYVTKSTTCLRASVSAREETVMSTPPETTIGTLVSLDTGTGSSLTPNASA